MPRKTTVAAFASWSTLRTSCFLPLPSKACLGLELGLGLGITRYTTGTLITVPRWYLSISPCICLNISLYLSIYPSCL